MSENKGSCVFFCTDSMFYIDIKKLTGYMQPLKPISHSNVFKKLNDMCKYEKQRITINYFIIFQTSPGFTIKEIFYKPAYSETSNLTYCLHLLTL